MAWVRFDDGYPRNRKVARLTDSAFRLHTSAVCWSNEQLTDGHIPYDGLKVIAPQLRAHSKAAFELVEATLWRTVEDGWVIHDYLEYQPSATDVKERRRKAAEKKRLQRMSPGDTDGESPGESAALSLVPSPAESPRAPAAAPASVPNPLLISTTSDGPQQFRTASETSEDRHSDEIRELLVEAIHDRRPAWSRALIRAAVTKAVSKSGSVHRTTIALAFVAADPESKSPHRVISDGWWWNENDSRYIAALNQMEEEVA